MINENSVYDAVGIEVTAHQSIGTFFFIKLPGSPNVISVAKIIV